MATALKLRADIKKYEAALKSKATPQSLKAKLEKQIEKAKSDLAAMRSKKPTAKKTKKSDLPKQFGAYKGSGVDIKKDSERPAKPVGKRKSKSGKTYYEYRLNRIDIKQPPKKYPKLEKGGMMANGGELSKEDFLKKSIVYDNGGESLDRYTVYTPDGSVYGMSETGAGFNQYLGEADEIPQGKHLGKKLKSVPKEIESEILSRMEYADGGMMAKGGKVGKKEFSAYTILNADEYGYRNSEGKMKPTKFYIVWYGNEYKLWMEDDNKYRVKFNDDDELKKAIDKVRYRLPQDQKFFKEFIVSEKFEYADGGMMAHGGELHRMDEDKMADGGEMKTFNPSEFRNLLDKSVETLYMGLNEVEQAMRYLEVHNMGKKAYSIGERIGLPSLRDSIEYLDQALTNI